jgi:pyruvate formate lyase activating enzyme
MIIAGFQKLSLLDYPKTPCAIIFTQGCSFRCAFCHNPELIPIAGAMAMPPSEVIAKLEAHRAIVSAVTITGGEPTLHADLPQFIKELKDKGFKVKLDTNGVNPPMIKDLTDANQVDYIAMDLKQCWEKYDEVVRVDAPSLTARVRETFAIIQNSKIDHEFRTTILPHSHSENDFMAIVGCLLPGEKYFVQETRFDITLEPDLPRQKSFDMQELLKKLRAAYPEISIESR